MSEQLRDREATDEPGTETDAASEPRRPRWTAAIGLAVGALVVVMLVVLHLTGAVGPGAH